MATKILKARHLCVLTLGASPFLSFKIHASDAENAQPTKIKISELPVYRQPSPGQNLAVVDEEIGILEEKISIARKACWGYLDRIKFFEMKQKYAARTQRAKDIMDTGVAHTQSTVQMAKETPDLLLRFGVIGMSGLGGIVLGYRGGPMKKLTFSIYMMMCATILSFPKATFAALQLPFRAITEQSREMVKQIKAIQLPDVMRPVDKKDDAQKDEKDSSDKTS